MGKLIDYAKMSDEVYNVPNCANIGNWQMVQSLRGAAGFKGACYLSADELVVVFAGTETSLSEIAQDAIADLLLGLGLPTRQTFVASGFYDSMMTHRGDRAHVTITGHSLGGGLSQAVGFMKSANFVTWNAPGMMQSILCTGPILGVGGLIGSGIGHYLRRRGAGDRGKNYRLPRDPVSLVNTHYGSAPITVQGGPQHTGHSIATFIDCLAHTHWGQLQPFGY
jgi:hypothetical protein